MSRASGDPDTPKRNWNNLPDLLRAMSVKASVKDGKISNLMERLPAYSPRRIYAVFQLYPTMFLVVLIVI